MIVTGIFQHGLPPGGTSATSRVLIIPTLVKVVGRHDQERLRRLDFAKLADHLEAIAPQVSLWHHPGRAEGDPPDYFSLLRQELWPPGYSVKASLELKVKLLLLLLREMERSGVDLPPVTQDLLEDYLLEHIPYAIREGEDIREEGDHFVAVRDSNPPDRGQDFSLVKWIRKWLGWSVILFGSPPLFNAAGVGRQNIAKSEPVVELSYPATALIAGAVLMTTFVVWWITDRVGHRDFMNLHEFHENSKEFQEAANEAVSALGESAKIEPLIERMKQHLSLMMLLRRPLQKIHRFRLDVGGDDPHILRKLDQRIQDCQDLLKAISDSHEQPNATIIRLADRRHSPKNGS